MIRTKILGKATNTVVLIKRTAAFFICGAKSGEIDNLLSNRCNFYFGSWEKPDAAATLNISSKLFLCTKDVVPDNGAASFTRSTKNRCFRHNKGIGYYNGPVLLETFRLQRRTLEQHFDPMQ